MRELGRVTEQPARAALERTTDPDEPGDAEDHAGADAIIAVEVERPMQPGREGGAVLRPAIVISGAVMSAGWTSGAAHGENSDVFRGVDGRTRRPPTSWR